MAKVPWRFQGNIVYGEIDPVVTVFMGELETDEETGVISIRQDIRHPVTMKLSEFTHAADLADAGVLQAAAAVQKQERIDIAIAAESSAVIKG